MSDLPLLGASLYASDLDPYLDWLSDQPRDLELLGFHDGAFLDGDWRSLAAEVKPKLAGLKGRLGMHGPMPGNFHPTDPAIRAVFTKRYLQGLDVCAEIGTTQMVIHSPYRGWDLEKLHITPHVGTSYVRDLRACLEPVVKRAEDEGVEVVLENIADRDPGQRAAVVAEFASKALKLSVDTGHANYAHHNGGAPAVDCYISQAGNDLAHVHLQDSDGFGDRHWALGDGDIRWRAVFAALEPIKSNPRLIIELINHKDIFRSAAYLADLGVAR